MSRRKRVRKARSVTRRAKRLAKASARAHVFLTDARERARVRLEIEASDAPTALKTVLGFLVDPIGAVTSAVAKEAIRRGLDTDERKEEGT